MNTNEYINYNGQIIKKKDFFIGVENRGFRYGDGIFETIRMFDGKIPFLEQHIKRLAKGIKFLQLELSNDISLDFWRYEIGRIVKFHQLKSPKPTNNYRIRLSMFRNDGGFYTPLTNKASYIIEVSPLECSEFEWNKKGKKIGIYNKVRLNNDKLSNLKTSNALPYVLAGIYNQQHGYDDCLLLNNEGNIAESIHSNIFLITRNKLITPDLSQGCTAGTMRNTIINIAKTIGLKVKEKPCSTKELSHASEVFLTNAIRGIQWVKSFEKHAYSNSKTKKLFHHLTEFVNKSIE